MIVDRRPNKWSKPHYCRARNCFLVVKPHLHFCDQHTDLLKNRENFRRIMTHSEVLEAIEYLEKAEKMFRKQAIAEAQLGVGATMTNEP